VHFLFIIDSLNFGGAERQVVLDANALVQREYNVTVGFFKFGPLAEELDPKVSREHIEQKSLPSRIMAVRRLFLRSKVDLVIAHMFRAEIVTAFAALTTRVPVIFNEHGLGLWRRPYHKWVLRIASLFSREIWCASEICRKLRAERDRLKAEKLRTVYNFFNCELIEISNGQVKDEILSVMNKSIDTLIIGFVGRFDPVKRLNLLLNIATREVINDAVFVLVGDGPQLKTLKTAVRKRGLESRFHFPGFVAKPADYFAAFDVFVLPSKRESLSIALLEACGAGLPAVVFDVGGNAEIIEHSVTGYVVADGDLPTFEHALRRLLKSPELRRDMGRTAAQRVSSMFSEQRRMDEIMRAANQYVHSVHKGSAA
jgi:glycosyltransferase involved in cell wall biosynthesis